MFNPWYVRAAIEANTGIHLTLDQTIQYCLEERLISKDDADMWSDTYPDYGQYFDDPVPPSEESPDLDEGLPDDSHSLED